VIACEVNGRFLIFRFRHLGPVPINLRRLQKFQGKNNMIVFKTVMKGIRTRFATELLNEAHRDYYPARAKVLAEFATMPSAGWSGLSSSGLVSAGGTPFDVQEETILVSEAKNGGRQ